MPVATLQLDLPLATLADYCRRNKIVELALFGSALREDFGPDSHIDCWSVSPLMLGSGSWRSAGWSMRSPLTL
ncbi:MAG TPA: nucleotidyltransferase domain-containing protein [Thermomicrobiales bacterium]|nr:nucleotidyltransferase domain-containing protein [Thermomicrobiales bacterium]